MPDKNEQFSPYLENLQIQIEALQQHLQKGSLSDPEQEKLIIYEIIKNIKENITKATNFFTTQALSDPKLIDKMVETRNFIPYIKKELDILHKQNKMETTSINDVFNLIGIDGTPITELDGNPIDNPYIDLIKRARKKFDADKFKEILPALKSKLPSNHFIPNNRLSNALQQETLFGEPTNLIVANEGQPSEITSYTMATLENTEGISITGKPYTEYDRQVHDAVVSLWVEGDKSHYFTPDMVYRAMTHRTQSESPSPQQVGAITRSLEKMRKNIHVYVDASEEMTKRKIKLNGEPVTKFVIDDFLLPSKKVTVKAGGKTVTAYLLTGEPILYNYARIIKQVITIPAQLLDIKKLDSKGNITTVSVQNTNKRISIKGYLMRRIEIIRDDQKKGKFKQSPIICFDTIFETVGITDRKEKADARNFTFQALEFWKKSKHIKDFKKRKRGKTFDAVKIEFDIPQK